MYKRRTVYYNDDAEAGRKIEEWANLQPVFSNSVCNLILLSLGMNPDIDLEKRITALESKLEEMRYNREPAARSILKEEKILTPESVDEKPPNGESLAGRLNDIDDSLSEFFSAPEEGVK